MEFQSYGIDYRTCTQSCWPAAQCVIFAVYLDKSLNSSYTKICLFEFIHIFTCPVRVMTHFIAFGATV
jgi:hypothetical protein